MKVSVYSYSRFLHVVLMAIVLASIGSFTAVAQETDTSRELERIDVEAPERRPATRATPSTRASEDYDRDSISDLPSSEDPGGSSQVFSGSGIPASTLSLVTGKSQVSIGATSLPAQVQTITSHDIEQLLPRGDYANLFRKVAGVKAVYYGQGRIGSGIMMRGFRNGSGNEVAIFIDGVPQNNPVASWHGISDISWLVPEAIEKIEIIKGPFSALYGDFALGGVVNIVTKKSDPSSSVNSYGGSFGNFRVLGTLSTDTSVVTPFLTHEYFTIDGYRDNSQLVQWSVFDKLSIPLMGGTLSVRYNYYSSDYGAPGYWPVDWVKSGIVNRKSAYVTSDGGCMKRYELVANYAPACGERGFYATVYTADYHRTRYATWLPIGSSQSGTQDDTTTWGGTLFYNLVFGEIGSLSVGGQTKQDSGLAQQYRTINRRRTADIYGYDARFSNWAVFMQGQIKPHDKVKIVGGVRWDYFKQEIDNIARPLNSGTGTPYVRSPKIGFVFTPVENFNVFGNAGCGFRSPAQSEISPKGAVPSQFGLDPAMVQTYDIGFNAGLFGTTYLAADYYHTYMQREIRTDPTGTPRIIGDTVRKGYEIEAKWFPSEDINFFASYAWVETEVIDPTTPGQVMVPEVSEHLIKGGVTMQRDFGPYGKAMADLYYEYMSGPPHYGSTATPVYGSDFDVYNFKLTYSGNGWSSFFAAKCKPRDYASDYYWVNSGLLMIDPQPKWELLAGVTYSLW